MVKNLCISTTDIRKGRQWRVRLSLSANEALRFSARAAVHYAQVRAELEWADRPVGPYEMPIGAHSRSAGLIIVANHLRGSERIPGLRVENRA